MINGDNVSNRNNKYLEIYLQNGESGNIDWMQTSVFGILKVVPSFFLPCDKAYGKNLREAVQV